MLPSDPTPTPSSSRYATQPDGSRSGTLPIDPYATATPCPMCLGGTTGASPTTTRLLQASLRSLRVRDACLSRRVNGAVGAGAVIEGTATWPGRCPDSNGFVKDGLCR